MSRWGVPAKTVCTTAARLVPRGHRGRAISPFAANQHPDHASRRRGRSVDLAVAIACAVPAPVLLAQLAEGGFVAVGLDAAVAPRQQPLQRPLMAWESVCAVRVVGHDAVVDAGDPPGAVAAM